jgi:hypothetical protein
MKYVYHILWRLMVWRVRVGSNRLWPSLPNACKPCAFPQQKAEKAKERKFIFEPVASFVRVLRFNQWRHCFATWRVAACAQDRTGNRIWPLQSEEIRRAIMAGSAARQFRGIHPLPGGVSQQTAFRGQAGFPGIGKRSPSRKHV